MKKICAIGFAAFYLLLTTGMFVCMLHCTGEYVLQPQVSNDHHGEKSKSHDQGKAHSHEEEPCSKDKDCKCCDQHSQYAVSENIQTAGSPFFSALAVLSFPTNFNELSISHKEVKPMDWPKGNAPPGLLKIPLYISNRTLLI
ncbi:MAG: hypothetical protein ACO1NU_14005 [Arcticibacter sp.]